MDAFYAWVDPQVRFVIALFLGLGLLMVEIVPRIYSFTAQPASGTMRPLSEAQIRFDVVAKAQSYLNLPYKFGGNDPRGFDCSGLVMYLYGLHGFTMPHGVIQMRPRLKPTRTPRMGDVIFFLNDNRIAGHVGIYVDAETFIHAPRENTVIRYEKLKHPYWQKRLVEVRSVM